MTFADRREVGQILAKKILKKKLGSKNLVVVAIPRGGILVAEEIANKLKLPLTVIVIKKLGAPNNAELAIGATASFGTPVIDRWLVGDLKVSREYLKKEIATKKKEARAREKFLNIDVDASDFRGKISIVVDDGVATGQTTKMAGKLLKQLGVSKLVLAVGCASPATIEELKKVYDEVICAEIFADFWAVGQFFRDFTPVEDSEVKSILAKHTH